MSSQEEEILHMAESIQETLGRKKGVWEKLSSFASVAAVGLTIGAACLSLGIFWGKTVQAETDMDKRADSIEARVESNAENLRSLTVIAQENSKQIFAMAKMHGVHIEDNAIHHGPIVDLRERVTRLEERTSR